MPSQNLIELMVKTQRSLTLPQLPTTNKLSNSSISDCDRQHYNDVNNNNHNKNNDNDEEKKKKKKKNKKKMKKMKKMKKKNRSSLGLLENLHNFFLIIDPWYVCIVQVWH